MFSDPQIVSTGPTLALSQTGGVAVNLPRVSHVASGNKVTSVYQNVDETLKMTISHETISNGRVRSNVRLDKRAVVVDPLTTEQDYDTLSVYCVIDRPSYGFSLTDIQNHVNSLLAELMVAAAIEKLVGKET